MKKNIVLILFCISISLSQDYPIRANAVPGTTNAFDLGRSNLNWDTLYARYARMVGVHNMASQYSALFPFLSADDSLLTRNYFFTNVFDTNRFGVYDRFGRWTATQNINTLWVGDSGSSGVKGVFQIYGSPNGGGNNPGIDSNNTTPNDWYTLANATSGWYKALGQSFIGNGTALGKLKFLLSLDGTPTGYVKAELYRHTGTYGSNGVPTGAVLATSDSILSEAIEDGLHTFTFSSPYFLKLDTAYVLVARTFGGTSSNYVKMWDRSTSHAGNVSCQNPAASSWQSSAGRDFIFYAYSATTAATTKYILFTGEPTSNRIDSLQDASGMFMFRHDTIPLSNRIAAASTANDSIPIHRTFMNANRDSITKAVKYHTQTQASVIALTDTLGKRYSPKDTLHLLATQRMIGAGSGLDTSKVVIADRPRTITSTHTYNGTILFNDGLGGKLQWLDDYSGTYLRTIKDGAYSGDITDTLPNGSGRFMLRGDTLSLSNRISSGGLDTTKIMYVASANIENKYSVHDSILLGHLKTGGESHVDGVLKLVRTNSKMTRLTPAGTDNSNEYLLYLPQSNDTLATQAFVLAHSGSGPSGIDTSRIVTTDKNQTISGVKTFDGDIHANGSIEIDENSSGEFKFVQGTGQKRIDGGNIPSSSNTISYLPWDSDTLANQNWVRNFLSHDTGSNSGVLRVSPTQNPYSLHDSLDVGTAIDATGVLRFNIVGSQYPIRLLPAPTSNGGVNVYLPVGGGTLAKLEDTVGEFMVSKNRLSSNYYTRGEVYRKGQTDTAITTAIAGISPGGGSAFDPATDYEFFDDFDVGTSVTNLIGRYKWLMSGAGVGYGCAVDSTNVSGSGVLGSIRLTGGTGAGNSYVDITTTGDNSTYMGSFAGNAAFTLKMRVKNYDPATKKKAFYFGVTENPDAPSANPGIYFYADSTTYHCKVSNGTTVDSVSTKGQTTNWTTFKIVSTGSSVGFYMGDTLLTTIATRIPTTGMKYFAYAKSNETVTTKRIAFDYFYCKITGLSR